MNLSVWFSVEPSEEPERNVRSLGPKFGRLASQPGNALAIKLSSVKSEPKYNVTHFWL